MRAFKNKAIWVAVMFMIKKIIVFQPSPPTCFYQSNHRSKINSGTQSHITVNECFDDAHLLKSLEMSTVVAKVIFHHLSVVDGAKFTVIVLTSKSPQIIQFECCFLGGGLLNR